MQNEITALEAQLVQKRAKWQRLRSQHHTLKSKATRALSHDKEVLHFYKAENAYSNAPLEALGEFN